MRAALSEPPVDGTSLKDLGAWRFRGLPEPVARRDRDPLRLGQPLDERLLVARIQDLEELSLAELKGRVELHTGQRGRPTVLSVLGAGDSFGEGSLLDDYPHSTSALVKEPAEVLEIPREAIATIAAEQPELYSRLVAGAVQLIVGQVRSASGRFAGRESVYLSGAVRREKDLLGEREIPDRHYYGIQTQRAVENFPITGIAIAQYPQLINALAAVKEAAAAANRSLGLLDDGVADAIIAEPGSTVMAYDEMTWARQLDYHAQSTEAAQSSTR